MIVGKQGSRYGLIKSTMFSADDDEDTSVNKKIQEEETYRKHSNKHKRQQQDILASDPLAFAYDEVYDDMKKTQKKEKKATTQDKKQPKYIKGLLKKAAEREKENDIIFQHRLQREAEAEKELFGDDVQEYITPSYKKQLEKNKRYEEKQRRKEEEDEKNDVRKKGDMSGFYSNLLNNNLVALGGNADDSEDSDSSESDSEGRFSPETRRERASLKRKMAQETMAQASDLAKERELLEKQKEAELKAEYAKHQTSPEEEEAALVRFFARKKARLAQKH
eukprot:TRINITY_DN10602_c0_g1_i1.p1 TRINITY_DN10602_c0_g1~~TRINITY_DN10602_c0_g1_i1.p1  ORF type:complete len:285 (-),score=94.69 TRINITY_DN10602_c0_g1_i1:68-901(-)